MLQEASRTRILRIAHGLAEEVEGELPYREPAIRLGLLQLLLELRRNWAAPGQDPTSSAVCAASRERVRSVTMQLLADPAQPITLASAAEQCGFAVSWFSILFRDIFGTSFGAFRLRARLARAAHLLVETDLSIDDLASRSGFAQGTYLHQCFRRHYGCTPATYRRRFRR